VEENFSDIFTEQKRIKKSILYEAQQTGDDSKVYDLLHTLDSVMAAPVIARDILYFTSTDGALYAFGH